jgi:hypothetical protein
VDWLKIDGSPQIKNPARDITAAPDNEWVKESEGNQG